MRYIRTSVVPVEYRDCKINVLDAPGFTDFVGEMISALSVADGAVILVDAVAGDNGNISGKDVHIDFLLFLLLLSLLLSRSSFRGSASPRSLGSIFHFVRNDGQDLNSSAL